MSDGPIPIPPALMLKSSLDSRNGGIPIAELGKARIVRGGRRERKREKVKDFINWFNKVIMDAELYEYRYPVKGGAYIWRPYGLRVRRMVEEEIRRLHDESGHGEVLFPPVFIPLEYFSKESEHIRGLRGGGLLGIKGR